MEIRDVIHSIREKSIEHSLDIQELKSEMALLERFLWEILSILHSGQDVVITFDVPRETEEGNENGDPTLF